MDGSTVCLYPGCRWSFFDPLFGYSRNSRTITNMCCRTRSSCLERQNVPELLGAWLTRPFSSQTLFWPATPGTLLLSARLSDPHIHLTILHADHLDLHHRVPGTSAHAHACPLVHPATLASNARDCLFIDMLLLRSVNIHYRLMKTIV